MTSRTLIATIAGAAVIGAPAVAHAVTDPLTRGSSAVRAAYEQTDGDEFGYGGNTVDQCTATSATIVRCVINESGGDGNGPGGNYYDNHNPVAYGIATLQSDDTITTSREEFSAPATPYNARISIPTKLVRTKLGNVTVKVRTAVASKVIVQAAYGAGRNGTRTVSIPAGELTPIKLPMTKLDRAHIRSALARRGGSIKAEVTVIATGNVGPADAYALRSVASRVVR